MKNQTRGILAALLVTALSVGAWAPVATAQSTQDDIDALLAKVVDVRGLEALAEVPVRTVAASVAIADQRASMTGEDIESLIDDERLLKRLELIPPDLDILEVIDRLAGEEVAGYYRPVEQDVSIVDTFASDGPIGRLVIAHELVHALQDQHYDLDATIDAAAPGDEQAAILALTEGDATFLMLAMSITDEELAQLGAEEVSAAPVGGELLDELPLVFSRELLFSYFDGMAFANRIFGRGGWEAVNAAWNELPRSSEQILHPERYPDDAPVAITLPTIAESLGTGWQVASERSMGELRTGILLAGDHELEIPAVPLFGLELPNADAAEGWGGDRIVDLDGPDGAWALVWQTAWDTAADAAEFADALDAVETDRSRHIIRDTSLDPSVADDVSVLVLIGDDATTGDAVFSALLEGEAAA